MKYIVLLVVLLPDVAMGQGLADLIGGTECENMYHALKDAIAIVRKDFTGPQNFLAELGLTVLKEKQLKKFACKLPDIKTIHQLAESVPNGDYTDVAGKYLDMLHKFNGQGGGVEKIIKMFKLYVRINEKGQFLPTDITSLPWYVDQNDALIFFSGLARDFGDDFPTFIMNQSSGFKGEFFNMTNVPEFVNSLYTYGDLDVAARKLGIGPRLLEAFLRVLQFAQRENGMRIRLYKRTYVLMEKLNDVGFFTLSIL